MARRTPVPFILVVLMKSDKRENSYGLLRTCLNLYPNQSDIGLAHNFLGLLPDLGYMRVDSNTFRPRRPWVLVIIFLVPFSLYLATLSPTIYNLDSAELTTAAATGGIVRATGYPLYLILGWLWSKLPIGDVGFRLNLFSAFCGAMTILLAELSMRQLELSRWARWGALGILAVAPFFWALSIIAEVYTLHTMLMAALILALLNWREAPSAERLFWPVLILAFSMGNHAATVLLVPGAILFVLLQRPTVLRQARNYIAIAAALFLGSLVFLYLPLRSLAQPGFNYAGTYDASGVFQAVDLTSWRGFVWLITGRSFSGQMWGYTLAEVPGQWLSFWQQLVESFFVVGILPGVIGFFMMWRRDTRLAAFFTLTFLLHTAFYVHYRVVDKNTMFLPSYLIWTFWLASGYAPLLDWLREGSSQRRYLYLGRLAVVAAVAGSLFWNFGRVNQANDWSTRQQSEAIMAEIEPNAVVFGWWDVVPGLQYLQHVEGQRPDVLIINRFLISGDDMEQFILTEAENRPIYINNPPLSLVKTMDVQEVDYLFRLRPLTKVDLPMKEGS